MVAGTWKWFEWGVYEQRRYGYKETVCIRAKMKKMLNWKCPDSGSNKDIGWKISVPCMRIEQVRVR